MNQLTTIEFIVKARKVHGNKYDYSKTKYINSHINVIITCNQCGNSFRQTPTSHLGGSGCRNCATKGGRLPDSQETFVIKARRKHGNEYDYSQVDYRHSSIKVKLIHKKCRKFFMQTPSEHLQGAGCPYCWIIARTDTAKNFIKQSIKVHDNKYDYSKVQYKSRHTPVKIFCKNCRRFFMQRPSCHLRGRGCPHCGIIKRRMNRDHFIARAVQTHGSKYDYSKTQYINERTHIEIFCNRCKSFFVQNPYTHLHSLGCPNCHKIILKDGSICDSMAEALYYLKLQEQNIVFEHHKKYGKPLGRRICDFYLPKTNEYIEVTAFNEAMDAIYGKGFYDSYLHNIMQKEKYVQDIGAKFMFIKMKLSKKRDSICYISFFITIAFLNRFQLFPIQPSNLFYFLSRGFFPTFLE